MIYNVTVVACHLAQVLIIAWALDWFTKALPAAEHPILIAGLSFDPVTVIDVFFWLAFVGGVVFLVVRDLAWRRIRGRQPTIRQVCIGFEE